jgi:hypothetical protein
VFLGTSDALDVEPRQRVTDFHPAAMAWGDKICLLNETKMGFFASYGRLLTLTQRTFTRGPEKP